MLEEYIEGCITRFNVMLRKCAILSLQGGAVTFLCSGSVEYFLFPVLYLNLFIYFFQARDSGKISLKIKRS